MSESMVWNQCTVDRQTCSDHKGVFRSMGTLKYAVLCGTG